jgi:hypothetical protein
MRALRARTPCCARGAKEVAILYRQQPAARAANAPPHWTSYIPVEDADATAARANGLGGAAVFRAPFDVLTPAAWLRCEIRPGRSCHSGSRPRGSARPW